MRKLINPKRLPRKLKKEIIFKYGYDIYKGLKTGQIIIQEKIIIDYTFNPPKTINYGLIPFHFLK